MPDWDADTPQLRQNLASVLRRIRDAARSRDLPTVAAARRWHEEIMAGLDLPEPGHAGRFRGEIGLERVDVRVGGHLGVRAASVAKALAEYERVLQKAVARLDELIPPGATLDADKIAAVLELCGWAHAEWVRVHPFANGNDRTARLWVSSLAMRYGLPPFVRLRPRPGGSYRTSAEQAMLGNWKPTVAAFHQMLRRFLREVARDG